MAGRYWAYPEYKDSKVEWLGDIPGHWDIYDGKRIFRNRRELAKEEDRQLAASQKYGVVPQSLMMELNDSKVMLALKGTDSFRHVEKNDFVISLRSFEGGIEYSGYDGCVSPAYTVLDSIKTLFHGFYRYLFKSRSFIAALQSTTDSLRDGKSITYQQFGAIPLVIPPAAEQTHIAKFLDHETAKIDTLIAKQQQFIALLKEKRQAVISHAVTKGLTPDAPMKDSGVEWLGEVPEHWEVKCLRHIGCCQNGINIGAEFFGTGYPFVSYGDVYNNKILPRTVNGLVQSSEVDRERYSVTVGDVFFTRTSETIDEIGFASTCEHTIEDATFAGFLIRFRPIGKVLLKGFSRYFFSNSLLRAFFIKEMNLVTRASLSQDLLKKLPVLLPPYHEQADISGYLDKKVPDYTELISNSQEMITLLQERRIALISAAVTGKIDVRNWQPPPTSTTNKDTP